MKVAALYDVHGMAHALEAVLRDAEAERVDLVVFGGDLIGGPFSQRALELARAVEARFVRGNVEREPDPWDRAHVDADDLRWLGELSSTLSLDGVLYCHAAPLDDTAISTVFTPDDVLRERFGGLDEHVVVIGHTHHQFDRTVDGTRVVNAGSVGMPYEDRVAAFWALVDGGAPSLRSTAFPVEQAAAEIAASGWPGAGSFVTENLLAAPSRAEAIAQLEARS